MFDSDDHDSGDNSSPSNDSNPEPSSGTGSDDHDSGGSRDSDSDKSKNADSTKDEEKEGNRGSAPDNKSADEASAKTGETNDQEKSNTIELRAGETTWALAVSAPNGSIPIGQPNTEAAPTAVPGSEPQTFATSAGFLEGKTAAIGPQTFEAIANASELKNGVIAQSMVEVEGKQIPTVAIYDSDQQQLSVVRDGVLSDGARIADILKFNLRSGEISVWDAMTGVTTVYSSLGTGSQFTQMQSNVAVGGLGLEFARRDSGDKGPALTGAQPGGITPMLGNVEMQQHFGIGSDVNKTPFSSNDRAPVGVGPKTRSFRAEKSIGGNQVNGGMRPERRNRSRDFLSNRRKGNLNTRPSPPKNAPSAANLPTSPLSRTSQPPLPPAQPQSDFPGLDMFLKGVFGAMKSYVAITEAAELIGTYVAYAELAELAGMSALAVTGVLFIPAAAGVAAGMGLAAGIAGIGIGIGVGLAALTGGEKESPSAEAIDTALHYGSAFGLAGAMYGSLTDPDKVDDYVKDFSEMEELKEQLGLED